MRRWAVRRAGKVCGVVLVDSDADGEGNSVLRP